MSLKSSVRRAAKTVIATLDPLAGALHGPRILIYHQVGVDHGREMEVTNESFRSQIDWIQERGTIVSLDEAIVRRGETGADRLFVVTFDDGFEDLYHNAFPWLADRRVAFTLYLTTRPIEEQVALDPRFPQARPMTWGQVNEMISSDLVTVGAHTHTHPDLRHADAEQVESELEVSNELIADRTGVEPRHFTYPWGWWSPTADRAVRERYRTATVGSPRDIVADSDLFTLGRIPIQRSDSTRVFRRRLETGMRAEAAIRRRLAGYSGP